MKNYQGYIRQYRYIALIYNKNLTDQECRLLDMYACLVCWDIKNKERFGTVSELTIKDIHDEHLPSWSTGKISGVIKSLIKKGRLTRLPKKRMRVENFWIYQASVQRAEQGFQLIEQGIHPTEQNVRLAEEKQFEDLQKEKQKMLDKFNPFRKNIQPNEQSESG